MKPLKLTLLVLVIGISCYAQEQPAFSKPSNQLNTMLGKWTGSGWVQMGSKERKTFNQTENVYKKLGEQLVVIEGEGRDQETGEVTFQAFAVIKAKTDSTLQFSAYTMEGQHTLAKAKMDGNNLVWWFEAGNGATIQYEIHLSEDSWVEDGYYMPNPEAKYPIFHMELTKQ